jgi:hypothetical protein
MFSTLFCAGAQRCCAFHQPSQPQQLCGAKTILLTQTSIVGCFLSNLTEQDHVPSTAGDTLSPHKELHWTINLSSQWQKLEMSLEPTMHIMWKSLMLAPCKQQILCFSAAENSNEFPRTRFWKGKSVEDEVMLGPMAPTTLVWFN